MLEMGCLTVDNKLVKISHIPLAEEAEADPSSCADESVMLQVDELGEKVTGELLKLYFENERKSGGGPVADVSILHGLQRAVITFKDPSGIHGCVIFLKLRS